MHNIQVQEETLSHTRITIGSNHYYFEPRVSLGTIMDNTSTKCRLTTLADVVYNYNERKFVKCKWMNVDKLNGVK